MKTEDIFPMKNHNQYAA